MPNSSGGESVGHSELADFVLYAITKSVTSKEEIHATTNKEIGFCRSEQTKWRFLKQNRTGSIAGQLPFITAG